VHELTEKYISKATPWLKWRAQLCLPGGQDLQLGHFPTMDEDARAYDAEVRRRGWAHARPLNFPQPDELAAYAQAGEPCDERGLPLSLAPEPPSAALAAAAAQGAADQRPPTLSAQRPGKSGFFGVTRAESKNKATPWLARMKVTGANKQYSVGYFTTKEEAARAYDAEVRRRGWTDVKRLNFLDPAADAALPPPAAAAAAAAAPGPD
jgi:hypothetical protein